MSSRVRDDGGNGSPTATPPPHLNEWSGIDSEIARYVTERTHRCLSAYRENPILVREHAGIERATAEGGYGRRQLFELVQNGADALLGTGGGRIHVVLTEEALYCANEGAPFRRDGVDAVLNSHISEKRGAEIGRFGLGFKSVLEVTSRPEVYSRSGSFGFDGTEAASKIREIVPGTERTPVLRIASPLDPLAAAADDPVLQELMGWASSVIRLPRDRRGSVWLSEDVAGFPREFLLFCPHVRRLILEDRDEGTRREVRLQEQGDHILLEEEGDEPSVWRVFATRHVPTPEAREDAGELADREDLPLMWGVRLHGKAVRGKFWSFFPTEYYTTLSGILNAPWKMNEDRQNLLRGPFNEELIDAAARLIAESLPSLVLPEDPGRFLSLMPARGREAPNWADELLTERTYERAAEVPSVPDQTGELMVPEDAWLHPSSVPAEALEIWATSGFGPQEWCHHTVDTRERRSRVERLLAEAGIKISSVDEWLEALTDEEPDPDRSVAALRAAAAVVERATPDVREEVREASIVLTRDGSYVRPVPGAVFIGDVEEVAGEDEVVLVHPEVAADEEGRAALETLGVTRLDASSALQVYLAMHSLSTLSEEGWERLWNLVGRTTGGPATELLKGAVGECDPADIVRAKTLGGSFAPLSHAFFPGSVVPGDGSRDGGATIDVGYHANSLETLRFFGAKTAPVEDGGGLAEPWGSTYLREAVEAYLQALPGRYSRPNEDYLTFGKTRTAGPLEPLRRLSEEGRRRMTELLLPLVRNEKSWRMRHKTRSDYYPHLAVDPPSLWLIKREGRLGTSLGVQPVGEAVGPALKEWEFFIPVASCGEADAELLGLPASLNGLGPAAYRRALEEAEKAPWPPDAFYAASAEHVEAPERLRCRLGQGHDLLPPSSVVAVWDPSVVAPLQAAGEPFLLVETAVAAQRLVTRWGCRPQEDAVVVEVQGAISGVDMPLEERFPGLESVGVEPGLRLIPCSSVRVETVTAVGTRGRTTDIARDGDAVYFNDALEDDVLLEELVRELNLRLAGSDIDHLLQQGDEAKKERVEAVRAKASLWEKVLEAVGSEVLRRRLPEGLVAAAERMDTATGPELLARYTLAVYGIDTLYELRNELRLAGLAPPKTWAGSYRARRFVRDLGFPPEFAGFRGERREPVLEVPGKPALPPLHDFQKQIVANVRVLVRESGRGLLSLPTGAGKTRVTAEALAHSYLEGELKSPVLWVAQSDELCEQAVQAWREVWRAMGPPGEPLHLNRLWAQNEADQYEGGLQVVVATMQKLQHVIGHPAYEWLAGAGCLVLDEAHHAVTRAYTAILRWLGLGRGAAGAPVLGLTATAFRGSETQTELLVNRFGGRRIDEGVLGADPYGTLQDTGVLSHVDHELLDGVDVSLTDDELSELDRLNRIPGSVADALGRNPERNAHIVASVRRLPDDWTVLLFAVSVNHARTLAALLTAQGVPAAAVSADTRAGARRHYIDQFRRGELRVLTNYGVLTTGFDAPSVQAIYVARPTFSPVLYQQMIGRGLRGPLNGGSERCLIVNVADNFLRFGRELAFREFDYLWQKRERGGE